jgi:hypothetical protein
MSQIKDIISRNTRKNSYTKKTWAEFDENQLSQLNVEGDTMFIRIAELEEIAKAVAHIGIDFGYGVYEIETKHIESARQYFLAKGGAE